MSIRGFFCLNFPNPEKRRANHKNQAVNLQKKEGTIMQRKKIFLVVCISLLNAAVWGQKPALDSLKKSFLQRLEWKQPPAKPGTSFFVPVLDMGPRPTLPTVDVVGGFF